MIKRQGSLIVILSLLIATFPINQARASSNHVPIVLNSDDLKGYELSLGQTACKGLGVRKSFSGWSTICYENVLRIIRRPPHLPKKMPLVYVLQGQLIKTQSNGKILKSELEGVGCSIENAFELNNNTLVTYYCRTIQGKRYWTQKPEPQNTKSPKPAPTKSKQVQAKELAIKGCNGFLPAVQAYYRNRSILELSIVDGDFYGAQFLDPSYIPLWNAYGELVAIVQNRSDATSWDRTQILATFNLFCGTNITLD